MLFRSALRSHVLHRKARGDLVFLPAQRVANADGPEASAGIQNARAALSKAGADLGALLDEMHAIDGDRVLVGKDCILRLFDTCHAPYPLFARLGRLVPGPLADACYRCFSRNRHKWFGVLPSSNWMAPKLTKVDGGADVASCCLDARRGETMRDTFRHRCLDVRRAETKRVRLA